MAYDSGTYDSGTYDVGTLTVTTGDSIFRVVAPMSPAIAGTFEKQPAEVLDYDVDFTPWGETRADEIASIAVTAPGLTVVSTESNGWTVKVTLSGGADGASVKVTTLVTTTTGRVREVDFLLKIKGV